MNRIERHAAEVRRALRLGERPGVEGLEQFVAWLHGRADVREWGADFGCCWHWPDGGATLWVPRGPRRAESLCHEAAHVLWFTGLARQLALLGSPVARTQHWREEYVCDRFARAFLLPPALVAAYSDDDELAAVGCCSLETVQRRRKELHFSRAAYAPLAGRTPGLPLSNNTAGALPWLPGLTSIIST